jgi:hypothetical protein
VYPLERDFRVHPGLPVDGAGSRSGRRRGTDVGALAQLPEGEALGRQGFHQKAVEGELDPGNHLEDPLRVMPLAWATNRVAASQTSRD